MMPAHTVAAALVMAHLHGDCHDSEACPWCQALIARQAYGYGLGYRAGIASVAEGSR